MVADFSPHIQEVPFGTTINTLAFRCGHMATNEMVGLLLFQMACRSDTVWHIAATYSVKSFDIMDRADSNSLLL